MESLGFTYLLRVRYGECDPQNVVFNARYADYADIAATEYMREIWGNHSALLAQGYDNQVVSLQLQWRASARFDDVLAISVHTAHVGNTSFHLQMAMFNWQTSVRVADATLVYVMVSTPQFKKVSIPSTLRTKLTAPINNVVVNHAGVPLSNAKVVSPL